MTNDTDKSKTELPIFDYPEAVLSRYSKRSSGFIEWVEEALAGRPDGLSPELCQLLAAYTSALNSCDFCHKSHQASAESLGVEPELVGMLIEDLDSAPCKDELKTLLRFVRKLNDSPARITSVDRNKVFEAGWTHAHYFDAVDICGLFNYFNRLVDSYAIELPANYLEMLHTEGHG